MEFRSNPKDVADAIKFIVDKLSKDVSKAKTKPDKLKKIKPKVDAVELECFKFINLSFEKLDELTEKISIPSMSYYNKIIIGNLIAIFVYISNINIGSVSNSGSSGTFFGIEISNLEHSEVVLGFLGYLLILYIGLVIHVIISHVISINIVIELKYYLERMTGSIDVIQSLQHVLPSAEDQLDQFSTEIEEVRNSFKSGIRTREMKIVPINLILKRYVAYSLTFLILWKSHPIILSSHENLIHFVIISIIGLIIADQFQFILQKIMKWYFVRGITE